MGIHLNVLISYHETKPRVPTVKGTAMSRVDEKQWVHSEEHTVYVLVIILMDGQNLCISARIRV
jgi:hypothetical protein